MAPFYSAIKFTLRALNRGPLPRGLLFYLLIFFQTLPFSATGVSAVCSAAKFPLLALTEDLRQEVGSEALGTSDSLLRRQDLFLPLESSVASLLAKGIRSEMCRSSCAPVRPLKQTCRKSTLRLGPPVGIAASAHGFLCTASKVQIAHVFKPAACCKCRRGPRRWTCG